ncbi:ParB/RepB/Spo0J family partition protein [Bryobacter aggregatus]|uniref:ParB/RepB/Spo0J family partition protein n=1 Tax=Bryobacter aggregatus TaxID=360054 RepID=UPI0004E26E4D|nr:ParB/RepB/Spo0J family partition protein [Bryobacter aggregatus]
MNKPHDPRRVLGKGLSALLPSRPNTPSAAPAAVAAAPAVAPEASTGWMQLPLDSVIANARQPRSFFSPEKLYELSESIKVNGIIQPILVRRLGDDYEIVAGERRWRAARMAGLTTVPVVIQDIADENILTLALIENIQRDDLNAIETAVAFDRLSRELNLTHEEIGRRTGKDRTTITNFLRLLRLPVEIQTLLSESRISMGHARALLALPTEELQKSVAEKVVSQGLSVRATEALVQSMTQPAPIKEEKKVHIDPNVKAAEEEVQRVLGTRVRILPKNEKRGRIEIEYYSPDELDRIYQQLVGEN